MVRVGQRPAGWGLGAQEHTQHGDSAQEELAAAQATA